MNLLAVGVSHRTAPMSVLERTAVNADDVSALLDELLRQDTVAEVLLLSTCNRVEVYSVVESLQSGLADVSAVLARHAGVDLADHLLVHYSGAAVEHVFHVAAGLDSLAVGEAQILGQLRAAYATASARGTVGGVLHDLVQQALRVGKRAHAETGIDAAGASIVSEALADAAAVLDGLEGRRALVVGAGSLAGLAVAQLRAREVAQVVVANRTAAAADRLAAAVASKGIRARGVGLDAVAAELMSADVVITCTGARDVVVTRSMVARAPGRIVICDLALPRDVEPTVRDLPRVTLVDLESLAGRRQQVDVGDGLELARALVADEVRRFLAARRSAAVQPTVAALRRRVDEVVDAELLRLAARLPMVPEEVHGEFAHTMHRVMSKVLHTPTVRIKEFAEGPVGDTYAEALRELFGLDAHPPTVLASPRPGR
jgi:glutamyl-tRNA reductase